MKCRKCKTEIEKKDPEQRIGFCDKCYAEIFGKDAREFDALQKKIAMRETWIEKVDNRNEDPVQTPDEAKAEAEKYAHYEKEIVELREKQGKLNVKGFE